MRNSGFGHSCELKVKHESVSLQSPEKEQRKSRERAEKEQRKSALRKIININYTPRSE